MKNIHLAGCILQDDQGRILLLHRNTTKRTQWEIPGGKIDEGEDAQATAVREIEEELGVAVTITRHLGDRSFTEDDYTMEYTWFGAKITDGVPKVMEPQTHDECRYFSLDDMQKLASELSPNAANFLEEVVAKRVAL
jgi:8-oxo-dGTP diphosphatase